MASIGGYRSPVDLGLGRTPITTDPALFDEFSDVYNAIHLLNEYLDNLRTVASGGGSGQTPTETLPFNRFFTAVALQAVEIGDVVSPSTVTGQNGMLKGALPHGVSSTAPECNFCGIALTKAAAGEEFRVGIGPATLEMPGATTGSFIWAYSQRATNGGIASLPGLYNGNPGTKAAGGGTAYPMPVGVCIVNGFVLFGPFLRRPQ